MLQYGIFCYYKISLIIYHKENKIKCISSLECIKCSDQHFRSNYTYTQLNRNLQENNVKQQLRILSVRKFINNIYIYRCYDYQLQLQKKTYRSICRYINFLLINFLASNPCGMLMLSVTLKSITTLVVSHHRRGSKIR